MLVLEDVFGHRLRLTAKQRRHILAAHPELKPYLTRFAEVVKAPEWVKRSRRDPRVYLYYRFYPDLFDGKYILVVARIGHEGQLLTCYVTDTIKPGELLWPTH